MRIGGGINRARCPIGIDVGARAVRAIQLDRGSHGIRVIHADVRPLSGLTPQDGTSYHQAVGEAIGQIVSSGRFSGNRVVSGLPSKAIHYKNLRLPKMPPDELEAAVEWEAAERLPIGSHNATIQYFDAGEVRQGDEQRQEVILMAVANSFVEDHLNCLVACGLEPIAFDVAPSALLRCLRAVRTDQSEDLHAVADVVIDLGFGTTSVLIVRGERVLFFKSIDIGGHNFDQQISEKLNVDLAEAAEMRKQLDAGVSNGDAISRAVYDAVRPVAADLAREIGLCLRYYGVTFRGRRPEEAYLFGSESRHSWLNDALNEGSGVQFTLVDPMATIDPRSSGDLIDGSGTTGAWTQAIGLSLRPESSLLLRGAA